jgi:quercetin dioxygenase-like cupin family protein
MKLTRIYAGPDGQSHFEDLELPMDESQRRATSDALSATTAAFGVSQALPAQDWHHAPRRQLVAVLSGALEIRVGDGSSRRFGVGDVFFADDLAGQGHHTSDVGGPMRLLYVHVPDDFDPSSWRA